MSQFFTFGDNVLEMRNLSIREADMVLPEYRDLVKATRYWLRSLQMSVRLFSTITSFKAFLDTSRVGRGGYLSRSVFKTALKSPAMTSGCCILAIISLRSAKKCFLSAGSFGAYVDVYDRNIPLINSQVQM